MKYTGLDTRMKRYEAVSDNCLMRRTPVILRLDMCHGHTFTKGFNKPFDSYFMSAMMRTMEELCKDIQGAVFGYTQSDEITIVLCDYQTLETSAWFDNRIEKLCSVAASKATRYFNKWFRFYVEYIENAYCNADLVDNFKSLMPSMESKKPNISRPTLSHKNVIDTAEFDCRAFNVPIEEVCNCVIWRQNDAEKNSIQSLAQSLYKHNEIKGIKNSDLQNKMFTEKGVNWNDLDVPERRGTCVYRNDEGDWYIDLDMPIIKKNREFVEKHIYFEEE